MENEMDMFPACFWPNGDWCWAAELEDYGRNKSDDFAIRLAEDDEHAEEIAIIEQFGEPS